MKPGHLARGEELLGRTKAERTGDRAVRPFQLFVRRQASGGLVLLGCAILALAWANSPWAWAYGQALDVPLGISFGEQVLRLDLRHWINDGLMAIFFFGIGLERSSWSRWPSSTTLARCWSLRFSTPHRSIGQASS